MAVSRQGSPLRDAILVAGIVLATSLVVVCTLWMHSVRALSGQVRHHLVEIASIAARMVDGDLHRSFTSPRQEETEAYRNAVAALRRVQQSATDVCYIYTIIRREGRVHFVLDTAEPGDANGDGTDDHSYIMQRYDGYDPEMVAAFRNKCAIASARPYADRWGTFISGYAPFYDSDGEFVGLVGVDLELDDYRRQLAAVDRAALCAIAGAAVLAAGIATLVWWVRRDASWTELRYRMIFDSSTDGLVVFDAGGRIVEANPTACRMHGYSREELINLPGDAIIPPELYANIGQSRDRCAGSGRFQREVECVRSDGTRLLAEVDGVVMPLAGRPHLLVIIRDISERRQAEEELRDRTSALEAANASLKELQHAAEAASRAKSEFLANMSHELRTPLTAILGYAELLRAPSGSAAVEAAAETIRRNGEFLIEIINDILDLSRIEAGRLQIRELAVSPLGLLEEVVTLMRVRADDARLPLAVRQIGDVPSSVLTDPVRLRQILINLIGNAIKFTSEGHVDATVGWTPDPGGRSGTLDFEVADTGIGMSADLVGRLFDPFTQGDASTRRRYHGTGLGLAISRRLAQMLGGDITVCSRLGKGSRFRVSLGVMVASRKTAGCLPAGESGPPCKRQESPPIALDCRILLAEDGPDNQRLLSFLLREAGAEVEVVENGQLALERVKTSMAASCGDGVRAFDLVLMDLQMPVMDGYESTRRLRQAGYDGPIVAISAHAMSDAIEQAMESGFNAYLTKPITRDRLLQGVASAMQGQPVAGLVRIGPPTDTSVPTHTYTCAAPLRH